MLINVFRMPKFFITLHGCVIKKVNFILQKSKYFFKNQSGLSLLEMTVVIAIMGGLLGLVINKAQSTRSSTQLTIAYQNITMLSSIASEYISKCDADALTEGGKKIFSILKNNHLLNDTDIIITKDNKEYLKISGTQAQAHIEYTGNEWFMWISRLVLSDAKKIKDKLGSGEIWDKNGAEVQDIDRSDKKDKYSLKIKIW